MKRITLPFTAVAALPLAGFASTPVATVSSAEAVTLAGQSVSAPGISSWLVVTGEEIATSTAPATILFRDGSSVALAAESSARLTGTSTQPKLVLISGRLNYKMVPGSKLVLSNSATDNSAADNSAADNSAADNDSGSTGDAGTIAPAPRAASTAAHGLSHGVMIAGLVAAAAAVIVIPVETLTQSAPASLPNLSAR